MCPSIQIIAGTTRLVRRTLLSFIWILTTYTSQLSFWLMPQKESTRFHFYSKANKKIQLRTIPQHYDAHLEKHVEEQIIFQGPWIRWSFWVSNAKLMSSLVKPNNPKFTLVLPNTVHQLDTTRTSATCFKALKEMKRYTHWITGSSNTRLLGDVTVFYSRGYTNTRYVWTKLAL